MDICLYLLLLRVVHCMSARKSQVIKNANCNTWHCSSAERSYTQKHRPINRQPFTPRSTAEIIQLGNRYVPQSL